MGGHRPHSETAHSVIQKKMRVFTEDSETTFRLLPSAPDLQVCRGLFCGVHCILVVEFHQTKQT